MQCLVVRPISFFIGKYMSNFICRSFIYLRAIICGLNGKLVFWIWFIGLNILVIDGLRDSLQFGIGFINFIFKHDSFENPLRHIVQGEGFFGPTSIKKEARNSFWIAEKASRSSCQFDNSDVKLCIAVRLVGCDGIDNVYTIMLEVCAFVFLYN